MKRTIYTIGILFILLLSSLSSVAYTSQNDIIYVDDTDIDEVRIKNNTNQYSEEYNIENYKYSLLKLFEQQSSFNINNYDDGDVELLWNKSIPGTYLIDSMLINNDSTPDIVVGTSSRDGITGNIIYPFEKGYFIGIGDVIGNEKEEIFTCYSIDY
ncbi:MAG: hypothetical protein DRN27_06645, partial [Thermoplasmata archaeon]